MSTKDDETKTETETETQPRKLLLGKRVLRHFNVRSNLHTGAGPQTAEPTVGGPAPTDPVGTLCSMRPG
jgi:hypothetical protein